MTHWYKSRNSAICASVRQRGLRPFSSRQSLAVSSSSSLVSGAIYSGLRAVIFQELESMTMPSAPA